jgi:hypothetical protein
VDELVARAAVPRCTASALLLLLLMVLLLNLPRPPPCYTLTAAGQVALERALDGLVVQARLRPGARAFRREALAKLHGCCC